MDLNILSIIVSYWSPEEIRLWFVSTCVRVCVDTIDLSYIPEYADYIVAYNRHPTKLIVPTLDYINMSEFSVASLTVTSYAASIRHLVHDTITELDVRSCFVSSNDMSKWNLPNLTKLSVSGDELTTLDFSAMRLSHLDVSTADLDLSLLPVTLVTLNAYHCFVFASAAVTVKLTHFSHNGRLDHNVLLSMPLVSLHLHTTPCHVLISSLTHLDVSYSRLVNTDLFPLNSLRLSSLDVSHNRLTDLAFLLTLHLHDLIVDGNDLTAAREINTADLRKLSLIECKLSASITGPALTFLDVSGNSTVTVDCVNVQHFDVSRTRIANVPPQLDVLVNLPHVTWLDVSHRDLSSAHLRFKHLRELRLVQCDITTLNLDCPTLTHLDVSSNPIEDISLLRTYSLQHLDLRYTNVTDAQLIHLADMPLRKLYLSFLTGEGIKHLLTLPLQKLCFNYDHFDPIYADDFDLLPSYMRQCTAV